MKIHLNPLIFATSLAVACLSATGLSAADFYWDFSGTGSWNTFANWDTASDGTGGDPTAYPFGPTDTVHFNASPLNAAVTSQYGGASLTLDGLFVHNTGTTALNTLGTKDLTVFLGTTGMTIDSGAGIVTFGTTAKFSTVKFTLGGAQTWTNNSSNTVSLIPANTINTAGYQLTVTGTGDITAGGSISGAGSIVKSGSGTLTLAVNNLYSGASRVDGGTLAGAGSQVSPLTVQAGGTLAPGNPMGSFKSTTTTFEPGSSLNWEVANWTGTTAGTHWDLLTASDSLVFDNTPGNKLTIHISGAALNFTESNKTFVIATAAAAITGFDPGAIAIDATAFSGTGTWTVQQTASNIELVYTAAGGGTYAVWASSNAPGETPGQDHDGDGVPNGIEYFMGLTAAGFTTNPGVTGGKVAWPKGGGYTGSYGTDYVVQTSADLSAWTDAPVGTGPGTVTDGNPLEFTLPAGDTTTFTRLKVNGP